jgi:2,3,4,5-tetrahydropyridine-2-carboxylate N-succinyltransferase
MKDIIEAAFENRADLNPQSASTEIKQAVAEAIQLLDSGQATSLCDNGYDDDAIFLEF